MKKYFSLANKTVFLTGASGGLGEQLAITLASQNASLVLVARNEERLKNVAEKCQKITTGQVAYYACDLTDEEQLAQMLTDLSTLDVDVVINNAGLGYFKNAVDFSQQEIDTMLDLNLKAVIRITQHFLPTLVAKKSGMVVQIVSQSGKIATPKTSIYSATKFAVIGYSNALRLELKKQGVHVMTVNPGPIATNFFNVAEPTGHYLESLGGIVLSPQVVAWRIVDGIHHYKREVNLPKAMDFAGKLNTVFPVIGDYLIEHVFDKK